MEMMTPQSGMTASTPEGRYILPTFEERTSYGFKRQDPYAKLFEDRIVFLGVQVDDASADDVMAQLLVLESQDPDRDIVMYINSPGGSFHRYDSDLRHHAVCQAPDSDRGAGSGGVRCRRDPRRW
jgi:Protease subunit of ATP-dependent Clp proteases